MTAYSSRPTSTNALQQLVNLTGHGFLVGQLLANVSGTWQNAKSDTAPNSAGTWMVSIVPSLDTFYVTQSGYLSGLPGPDYTTPSNFTIGAQYFLSATKAGTLTTVAPNLSGESILPCFVADGIKSGYFYGGSGTIIEGGSSGGLTPVFITTSQTLTPNTRNFVNGGSQLNLTMPVTSNVNDVIILNSVSSFGYKTVQAAGQQSQVLGQATTLGVSGYIESQNLGDSITLVCVVQNDNWFAEVVNAPNLIIN